MSERPTRQAERAARKRSRLSPKRVVIIGLSAVVVFGGGGFVAYRAVENANRPVSEGPSLDELARLASGDLSGADPETDQLKAAAVQAWKADRLKEGREDNDPLDPIVVKEKAPGGDGFPPANFPPGSTPSPGSNKAVAKEMLSSFGFGADQWGCLERLWHKESGWNERAMNRYSGAYGIPQSLPGTKMASAGADWQTNPATQIKWGLGYIKGRYGTPCGAWGHSQARGWY
ncbi:lytic transglycosylase domain-containing protein [Nonomuraea sp. MCN248]|uniref:Lytic transglycosylase domain-containing protein n=1 Tax=Nonomuraea corallina TaxID=2989783 RepID=A0ABT4SER5_9ACTN|nr:lytic transglycosylase domain-containing protein [Nonomuraea corallina]MDA0635686.1 lytic transglycosylase domain-containing protein [Nonomuraea corallina]